MVIEKATSNEVIQLLKHNKVLGRALLMFLFESHYCIKCDICNIKGYSYSKWKLLQIYNQQIVLHKFDERMAMKELQSIDYNITDENDVTIVINTDGKGKILLWFKNR